jgi:hypothetical protein
MLLYTTPCKIVKGARPPFKTYALYTKLIVEQDNQKMKNRPDSLIDNIDTIINAITQGDADKKKALEMRFFYLAEAPEFLKHLEPKISGEYFSVR